jgi:hypothetical protein
VTTDAIALTIPASLRYAGVASLVAGGVAGRLGYSVERIDDLQLALSSVLAAGTEGEDLGVELESDGEHLRVGIGPLYSGVGDDAGLLRIVRPLVDRVSAEERADGEWLVLAVRIPAA